MKTLKTLTLMVCMNISAVPTTAGMVPQYIAVADNTAIHAFDSIVISGKKNTLPESVPDKQEVLTPMCEACQAEQNDGSQHLNNPSVAAILPQQLLFPVDKRLGAILRRYEATAQSRKIEG